MTCSPQASMHSDSSDRIDFDPGNALNHFTGPAIRKFILPFVCTILIHLIAETGLGSTEMEKNS